MDRTKSAKSPRLVFEQQAENAIIFPRDCGGWAWPLRALDGTVTHVQQVKEQRYVAGRKATTFPSPHRLRDTFATAALEAGVDPLSLKMP